MSKDTKEDAAQISYDEDPTPVAFPQIKSPEGGEAMNGGEDETDDGDPGVIRAGPYVVQVVSDSLTGKRDKNEDAYHEGNGSFIIADGVGGKPDGAGASQAAVEAAAASLSQATGEDPLKEISQAIMAANKAVHVPGTVPDEQRASTILILYFTNNGVWYGHVGDGRLYRLREGTLTQITSDHTAAQEWKDGGQEAPKNVGHVLTSWLGSETVKTRVDIGPLEEPVPGDRYLLSTDGLHDCLLADALETYLWPPDPGVALVTVVEAVRSTSHDNLTGIVIDVLDPAKHPDV